VKTYDHKVNEEFVQKRHLFNERTLPKVDRKLGGEPGEQYIFGVASDAYCDGVLVAWALEDADALAAGQERLTAVYQQMLKQFDRATIQRNLDLPNFLPVSLASDADAIKQIAEALAGRPHVDRPHRTSPMANHQLLEALVELVRGNDEAATRAINDAKASLAAPENPPTASGTTLHDAVLAVIDGDSEGLTTLAQRAIEAFAETNAPTKSNHAGIDSLVHTLLTLLCRVARWRGLDTPESPYILPFAE